MKNWTKTWTKVGLEPQNEIESESIITEKVRSLQYSREQKEIESNRPIL